MAAYSKHGKNKNFVNLPGEIPIRRADCVFFPGGLQHISPAQITAYPTQADYYSAWADYYSARAEK